MDRQIVYYYQRGVASYVIAKQFGVSNTYVRSLLKKRGIPLRGHDVTNKASAQKRTPEQNKSITKRASESNKGSVHTQRHRIKLALSRERNPTIDPVYEQPLLDQLLRRGFNVVPQKAFDKFNVDLYLVEENVVIEIFGGGFHNKKSAVDLFNNKMQYLSSINIPVVIVWADKLTYNPQAVINVCRKVKTRLTVINGDGRPTTRGIGSILNY